MLFQILSEREIKHLDQKRNHIIISIRSPKALKAQIPHNYTTLDILYLEFHDLDKLTLNYPLFSSSQAKKILNFVDKYKDKIDLIICQCEVGISRSAGVAGALSKILNGEDTYIFKHYCPNRLVYRTILNEAGKCGLL